MIQPIHDDGPQIIAEPIAVTRPVAGELLGLSERSIDLLIQRGELPVLRVGRAVRIRVEALRQWAAKAENAPENASRDDEQVENAGKSGMCASPEPPTEGYEGGER